MPGPARAGALIYAKDLGLLSQQWTGPGFVVRNAFDPEGNILQLRELPGSPDPL